jgi:hypothetical protein
MATLLAYDFSVKRNDDPFLKSKSNLQTCLWPLPIYLTSNNFSIPSWLTLLSPQIPMANAIKHTKTPDLVAFAPAALLSLALSTLRAALKRCFIIDILGLTPAWN